MYAPHRLFLAAIFAIGAVAAEAQDLGACPARGVSWTANNLKQCIDDFTQQIEKTEPQSRQRATLLAKRAQANRNFGAFGSSEDDSFAKPHFEAALADYTAALAIVPQDADVRHKRAQLLIDMERPTEALADADVLTRDVPDKVRFYGLKGWTLSKLGRHKESIEVYTRGIELAQSCAEASLVQKKINEYRRAFDPPPTREEMFREIEMLQIYDIPEKGVLSLGFKCTPSPVNAFEDLVIDKSILFQGRAESHKALSDLEAAFKDYRYAVSISFAPEIASVSLCELSIDLKLPFVDIEPCRRAFDTDTVSILSDPVLGAKIGSALLNDGDLKGACRLAFPPLMDKKMRAYVDHVDIKSLQQRAGPAARAAGFTRCETDLQLNFPVR
jgi:tetratricopeptide (TPR) repeat protein